MECSRRTNADMGKMWLAKWLGYLPLRFHFQMHLNDSDHCIQTVLFIGLFTFWLQTFVEILWNAKQNVRSPEKLVWWGKLGKFSQPFFETGMHFEEKLCSTWCLSTLTLGSVLHSLSLFSFNQLLWLFRAPFLPLAQPYYWQVNLRAVLTEQHFPSCEENLLSSDRFSGGQTLDIVNPSIQQW